MDNCEIVENTACGKPFQYCRTHKVEAQDCPGKVQTPTVEGSYSEFEITTRYQAPKREFKVGDKVRVTNPGVHEHLRNAISEVTGLCYYPWHEYPIRTNLRGACGARVCFNAQSLEHV